MTDDSPVPAGEARGLGRGDCGGGLSLTGTVAGGKDSGER
jgi:hypothetical protein